MKTKLDTDRKTNHEKSAVQNTPGHLLAKRRWKIVLLSRAGFTRAEIRSILGISRRTLFHDLGLLQRSVNGTTVRPCKAGVRLFRRACEVLGVEHDEL